LAKKKRLPIKASAHQNKLKLNYLSSR